MQQTKRVSLPRTEKITLATPSEVATVTGVSTVRDGLVVASSRLLCFAYTANSIKAVTLDDPQHPLVLRGPTGALLQLALSNIVCASPPSAPSSPPSEGAAGAGDGLLEVPHELLCSVDSGGSLYVWALGSMETSGGKLCLKHLMRVVNNAQKSRWSFARMAWASTDGSSERAARGILATAGSDGSLWVLDSQGIYTTFSKGKGLPASMDVTSGLPSVAQSNGVVSVLAAAGSLKATAMNFGRGCDASLLAVAHEDDSISIWNWQDAQCLRVWSAGAPSSTSHVSFVSIVDAPCDTERPSDQLPRVIVINGLDAELWDPSPQPSLLQTVAIADDASRPLVACVGAGSGNLFALVSESSNLFVLRMSKTGTLEGPIHQFDLPQRPNAFATTELLDDCVQLWCMDNTAVKCYSISLPSDDSIQDDKGQQSPFVFSGSLINGLLPPSEALMPHPTSGTPQSLPGAVEVGSTLKNVSNVLLTRGVSADGVLPNSAQLDKASAVKDEKSIEGKNGGKEAEGIGLSPSSFGPAPTFPAEDGLLPRASQESPFTAPTFPVLPWLQTSVVAAALADSAANNEAVQPVTNTTLFLLAHGDTSGSLSTEEILRALSEVGVTLEDVSTLRPDKSNPRTWVIELSSQSVADSLLRLDRLSLDSLSIAVRTSPSLQAAVMPIKNAADAPTAIPLFFDTSRGLSQQLSAPIPPQTSQSSVSPSTEERLLNEIRRVECSLTAALEAGLAKVALAAKEHEARVDQQLKSFDAAFGSTMDRHLQRAANAALHSIAVSAKETAASAIKESVNASARSAFSACFQETVIPSFEKATQHMFTQISQTFDAGLQDLVQVCQTAVTGMAKKQLGAAATAPYAPLGQARPPENVSENLAAALLDPQSRVAQAVAPQPQQAGRPPMVSIVPAPSASPVTPTTPTVSQPQQPDPPAAVLSPVPPANVSSGAPEDVYEQLRLLLGTANFDAAFNIVLSKANLDLVVWLCKQVGDPSRLSAAGKPLSQHVLLSLVQQLGFDLASETELKVTWLSQVLVLLDPKDPASARYVPAIVSGLLQKVNEIFKASTAATNPLASSFKTLIHIINTVLMTWRSAGIK